MTPNSFLMLGPMEGTPRALSVFLFFADVHPPSEGIQGTYCLCGPSLHTGPGQQLWGWSGKGMLQKTSPEAARALWSGWSHHHILLL